MKSLVSNRNDANGRKPSTGRVAGVGGRWPWWAAGVLAGGLLLAVHLRVLSYVTGQDPFTYTRLAMELLNSGFSLECLGRVAEFVVPGYPLLLAGVIRVAGPFAVSWVNVVIMILAFGLLIRLLRQWGFPAGGALIICWAAIWLVFRSRDLNAQYLFFAFRGAPQFFLVVGAYSLAEGAIPSSRGGGVRLALATGMLLTGALIRETALLAWPALAVRVAWGPEWRGARIRGLAWLTGPLVLLPLAGFVVVWSTGAGMNQQAGLWLRHLTQGGGNAYWSCLAQYVHLLHRYEWGWIGLGSGLLGLWHLRRRLHLALLWVLPALLGIAFYSGYKVHRRYLLDSLMLLSVVSSIGIWQALTLVRRGRNRFWDHGVLVAAAGLLLGLNLHMIQRLPAWGPTITKADVERFVETTKRWVPDPARLWADGNCRYLTDAAWIHLGALPMPGGESMVGQLAEGDWHYWRRASPDSPDGIYSDDLILQHADMHPVVEENGQTVETSLGEVPYRLYRISPWTNRIAEQAWEPEESPLLWLDFQESDPAAERQVRLLNSDGTERQQWTLTRGNGLIPLAVEPRLLREGQEFRVVVESSGVLPSKLIRIPEISGTWDAFTMERGRLPSAWNWVRPPAHLSRPDEKWGVGITRAARFEFPVPRGSREVRPVISLLLEPRFRQNREVVFQYRLNGEDTVSFTNRLHRGRFRHELPVPRRVESGFIQVDLSVEVPEDWDNHFRLVEIGYQLQ